MNEISRNKNRQRQHLIGTYIRFKFDEAKIPVEGNEPSKGKHQIPRIKCHQGVTAACPHAQRHLPQ